MENKREYDLCSLGEVMLRLSPQGNERIERCSTLEKTAGGAELNVCAGVSQLGLRSGIISKVPDNGIGSYVRNQARSTGVSDDYLISDPNPKSRLGVYYYEGAAFPRKPSVIYDRDGSAINTLKVEELPDDLFEKARMFHTSGITLALSDTLRETAIEMMRRFKEAGALISFDVNFRGNLWTGAEAKKCIESILPLVDLFFCSDETARLTFGKSGESRQIMKSFTEEYPICVVASTKRTVHSPKRHSFTSVIYDRGSDTFYEEEPYRDIEVVDRIGSGDAYVAGMLYGYLKYGDCRKALEFGNALSAIKNTIPGDMTTSSREEVEAVIEDHQHGGAGLEMKR